MEHGGVKIDTHDSVSESPSIQEESKEQILRQCFIWDKNYNLEWSSLEKIMS